MSSNTTSQIYVVFISIRRYVKTQEEALDSMSMRLYDSHRKTDIPKGSSIDVPVTADNIIHSPTRSPTASIRDSMSSQSSSLDSSLGSNTGM